MTRTSLQVNHIARIEGHGNVHMEINDGIVEKVEINVVEPARFFESMVRGRDFSEVSYIASRICGICSASHVVTDLKAIERIFHIVPSERTHALRELLVYGSYLQNHGTHLFVLAAPDFVGAPDVFPLAKTNPELFASALALKALGNELCNKVGGRSIHPITAVVGGFTQEIPAKEYLELACALEEMIPFAIATVDLFKSFKVSNLATKGDFLAMVQDGSYPIEGSDTARFLRAGISFDADELHESIEEYQVGHSAALFSRVKATGESYMTGALARVNASWRFLSSNAKVAAAKARLRPPKLNPFDNNVAQAVELVDALERCAGICRKLARRDFGGSSAPKSFEVIPGRAVGFTEAPRGALFHELAIDEKGKVTHASIHTPTAQNIANLEADLRLLVDLLASEGRDVDAIKLEAEKLIRAYDACLSCSVH
ncbi:MAG: Ni/Fe hydrogenase subunit alpha [Eggerthellaceae bacterium]|nr:Ni/Fe hydrogenase subunit alpha [Eggerthellaceae bacterium]